MEPTEFDYKRGSVRVRTTCWIDCDDVVRCFTTGWPASVDEQTHERNLLAHQQIIERRLKQFPERGSLACDIGQRDRPGDFIDPNQDYPVGTFEHIERRVRESETEGRALRSNFIRD